MKNKERYCKADPSTPVGIRADLKPEQLITGWLSRDDKSDWHPIIFLGSIIYNLAHCVTQRNFYHYWNVLI